VKIHRQSWLKQLRVAVSTRASVPASQVHKIRKTNFVDLRHITYDFKIREKFLRI
jgi:hypothetical protein